MVRQYEFMFVSEKEEWDGWDMQPCIILLAWETSWEKFSLEGWVQMGDIKMYCTEIAWPEEEEEVQI